MMAPNVAIIATNHNIARTDIPMNLQGSVDKEIYIYIQKMMYELVVVLLFLLGVKTAKGPVATKNVETFTVIGGNTAKIIKKRKMF